MTYRPAVSAKIETSRTLSSKIDRPAGSSRRIVGAACLWLTVTTVNCPASSAIWYECDCLPEGSRAIGTPGVSTRVSSVRGDDCRGVRPPGHCGNSIIWLVARPSPAYTNIGRRIIGTATCLPRRPEGRGSARRNVSSAYTTFPPQPSNEAFDPGARSASPIDLPPVQADVGRPMHPSAHTGGNHMPIGSRALKAEATTAVLIAAHRARTRRKYRDRSRSVPVPSVPNSVTT